ncbi:MAG: hypothetical protein P4M10_00950 [Verrucomicrobiae bacterium]|jgi:hypothetical protein|nr:hypothetical protein [Verrucomicrobiae bacterium]
MNQSRSKRSPSAHQKQMRFYAIFFVTAALVVFAAAFYLAAWWMAGNHGHG